MSEAGALRVRRALAAACAAGALFALACFTPSAPAPHDANVIRPLELAHAERLLVMVPHPDDEVLCCAGLIARVLAEGGSVHLVYATHGDGYREGVVAETREASPGPEVFRAYGERRRRESLAVLHQLGVPERQARFLGFPDGGLRALWDHRFQDERPYRSRTTAADRPPYPDSPARGRSYTAEHLETELARALDEAKPTLLVIPDPRDQHGDHNALGLFSIDAFTDASRSQYGSARILTYLVHWRSWPEQTADLGAPLEPPHDFATATLGWRVLALDPAASAEKRRLLHLYATQMTVMGSFLERFPRRNELFGALDDLGLRPLSDRGHADEARRLP